MDEKFSSANFFFNLCTSANMSCLQAIYFVFLGRANNFFFNIFHTPLQKNNGPSQVTVANCL